MTISKLKQGAATFGAVALVLFLLSPFVFAPPTVQPQFDDMLHGRAGYVLADLHGPLMDIPLVRMQFADADTLDGSGNTAFAQEYFKVWETKMKSFNYSRMQMSAVYGDTSGEKLVVPGMSAGDIITSVLYLCEDGIVKKHRDMTDSTWYSADSILIGAYTDSGTVIVLFQDRTD